MPAETIEVSAATDWQLVCAIAHDGFRTDLRRDVVNSIASKVWDLQDGYGEPGYTPPQGWDWSGIRDSSADAKKAMGKLVRRQLARHGVTVIQLEDEMEALKRFGFQL